MSVKNPFFVIISPPRCKSTYLNNLLHSHPQAKCHAEIFHHEFVLLDLPGFPPSVDLKWRNEHPHQFIEKLIQQTQFHYPSVRMVGCKLMLYSYQIIHGLEPVLDFKPRVIFLNRSNKLAWYSSLKIAIETNIWAVGDPVVSQYKINFNSFDFQVFTENQIVFDKYALDKCNHHRLECMHVEYNELANQTTIKKILQFLDLPITNLSTDTLPMNSPNILDRFHNVEDVKKYVSSIGKSEWLDY